jgi:hypothetical protein
MMNEPNAHEGLNWFVLLLTFGGMGSVWVMLAGWWKDLDRAYRFDEAIDADHEAASIRRNAELSTMTIDPDGE